MRRFRLMAVVLTLVLTIALPAIASAHPHTVHGQVIANGQNHGPYSAAGETCGGDPAAYGLESAHHGPDSGSPGKADGCYQLDSMPPTSDDQNPAID